MALLGATLCGCESNGYNGPKGETWAQRRERVRNDPRLLASIMSSGMGMSQRNAEIAIKAHLERERQQDPTNAKLRALSNARSGSGETLAPP